MTIFTSAYATTACKGFSSHISKITESLEKAVVLGGVETDNQYGFTQLSRGDVVAGFYHPIVMKNQRNEEIVVGDIRPFSRINQNGEIIISNVFDYEILRTRCALNRIWVEKRPELLRDVGPLPIATYCSWISENLTRRFALTPREQLNVAILAGVLYNCLFSADTSWSDIEKNKIAANVAKNTRSSIEDVYAVIDRVNGPIADVGEFCAVCVEVIESVRLRDLSTGLLFEILKGSWFGTNAAEMACVALEHPPTWISLCHAGATERTFRKSGIAQIIERGRRDDVKIFGQSLMNLLQHI